jgi:hypothetical protein
MLDDLTAKRITLFYSGIVDKNPAHREGKVQLGDLLKEGEREAQESCSEAETGDN